MPALSTPAALPRFRRRWAGEAGLLVLSPISAEHLIGYGESTAHPRAAVWNRCGAHPRDHSAHGSRLADDPAVERGLAQLCRRACDLEFRRRSAKAPSWWLVGGVTGVAWCACQLLPATWAGVTVNVVALVVLGWLLLRWSRRQGWGRRHVLAAAGSALVIRAGLSFLVEPPGGNVGFTVKYAVNAAMLGGVAALLLMAARGLRRQEPSAC